MRGERNTAEDFKKVNFGLPHILGIRRHRQPRGQLQEALWKEGRTMAKGLDLQPVNSPPQKP